MSDTPPVTTGGRVSLGATPVPAWESLPDLRPRVHLLLGLVALALLFAGVFGVAFVVDDRGSAQVARESTRVPATVSAIHVRDDVVTPSRVVLRLDVPVRGRSDITSLTVLTDEEDEYRVGQHVIADVDLPHLQRSAIAGDENGPVWTLGCGYVGIFGSGASALAALVVLLLLLSDVVARSRQPMARRVWLGRSRARRSARLAMARAALAEVPLPGGCAPTDPRGDVRIAPALRRWRRASYRGGALAAAIASAGVVAILLADRLHGVANGAAHLIGLVAAGATVPTAYLATRGARAARSWARDPGPWTPAAVVFASDQLGQGVVVSTDPDHAAIYRLALDPLLPPGARVAPGPQASWISVRGRFLALTPADGDGLLIAWTGRGLQDRRWAYDLPERIPSG